MSYPVLCVKISQAFKDHRVMKSWQLFLSSRDNDFKVASHIISCSILYNSRLVTIMTSPVELHFHYPVGYFFIAIIFLNSDSYFETNIRSSLFGVIRGSWSESNNMNL